MEEYGAYPQHPSPPPYGSSPQTNGLAIASLVLSILGLVGMLPLLGTILGLIFGYSAKRQIAQSRGSQGGEGLAQAGVIIGWVTLGLYALVACLALAGLAISGGLTGCAVCSQLETLLRQGY